MSAIARLKFAYLGMRIRSGFAYADVISAESASSLNMLGEGRPQKLFLSVNGSDDELACLQSGEYTEKAHIATVVGTANYKALDDSLRVFEMLRRSTLDSRW